MQYIRIINLSMNIHMYHLIMIMYNSTYVATPTAYTFTFNGTYTYRVKRLPLMHFINTSTHTYNNTWITTFACSCTATLLACITFPNTSLF